MSSAQILALAPLCFAFGLFVIAAWVERRRGWFENSRWRARSYALALGVYCSSWTYFGAVGSAATAGWTYLPIYLGPAIVFLLAPRFLRRLVATVHAEGSTSISDFIGSRFGKSRGLAALVTLTAMLGIVPYIALQLRSVSAAYHAVGGASGEILPMAIAAALFAGFAIAFGTQRYDAAARNEGLLAATGLESLVKLIAFGSVGVFALWLILRQPVAVQHRAWQEFAQAFSPGLIGFDFVVMTGLSMAAVLCLPRQFYVGVIEARGEADLANARWAFVGYLAAMVAIVPPITAAGLTTLAPGTAPDVFVLALPVAHGLPMLSLLAFIGGVAAATGMVVVESIALATMVSNDLVIPLLLRSMGATSHHFPARLLTMRRVTIGLVVAIAFFWAAGVRGEERLAAIGQIAFAAMAQIAPLLLVALRSPNNDAVAGKAALAAGLGVWLYTLALPPVMPDVWLHALSGTLIDPHRMLMIGHADVVTHGAVWSLGVNLATFALVAARRVQSPIAIPSLRAARPGNIRDMRGLMEFTGRFAGREKAVTVFADLDPLAPVGLLEIRKAERLVASAVGAPSARALIASAIGGASLSYEDAARLLDASGQSLQFSKDLLAATLENIDPGVSVVDGDLRLIAWNSRYVELFDYPPGLVRVGAHVADLIRFNAERGDCGPGEVDAHVERRLEHLRRGAAHSYERHRYDGRVLKIVGGPMPGGGYVTCFTDVTSEARARAALVRSRAELEDRVAERTAELVEANRRLASADREKTRFLAAASHDLLQPLHAARLFAGALVRTLDGEQAATTDRLLRSIRAAEELLRALLDISKLDAGGVRPEPVRINLSDFVGDIAGRFEPLAAEKGLALRRGPAWGSVVSDPALLRSIVQNFLSNAVRYTDAGSILIGVRGRMRGGVAQLGISVVDTGCGISAADQQRIFREFERLSGSADSGIGLGLAIVERTARLIDGEVAVRSRVGRGSAFTLWLARALDGGPVLAAANPAPAMASRTPQRVLIVDDDRTILSATAALMTAAGHQVIACERAEEALSVVDRVDVALVDLHLGAEADGLTLIERLREAAPGLRAALVTSSGEAVVAARARAMDVPLFQKPASAKGMLAFVAG